MRSQGKKANIEKAYPNSPVSSILVPDITTDGAFDNAVQSEPPFDAVMHAASPFHFKSTQYQTDILDPALKGTLGILKSIHAFAPNVKRVIITSSMAAVLNLASPPDEYNETSWNPITQEEALNGPVNAYMASKTFAERAAWEFVRTSKPSFTLATINPPGVFGPPIHDFAGSLDNINTSNGVFADLVRGQWKSGIPENSPTQWVDVRDVAQSHVRALTVSEAEGRRFLMVAGYISNAEIADIVRREMSVAADLLPPLGDNGKMLRDGIKVPEVDTEPARNVLDVRFISVEESVVDTVKRLMEVDGRTRTTLDGQPGKCM